MNSVILEARSLTKEYKQTLALDHINLQIKKGKIYGFIGQNGAGKTTFLRLVTGLAFPTSGTLSCNLLEYLTQRDIQTKNSGVNVRYRGKHRFFKGFNEFIKEKTRRCDNDFEKIERHVFF